MLGATRFSPEQLEEELAWIDAHVDGAPYGVDVLVPEVIDPRVAELRDNRARAALSIAISPPASSADTGSRSAANGPSCGSGWGSPRRTGWR